MEHCRYDEGYFVNLDVAHGKSSSMSGYLQFEEMDFADMNDDVGMDAVDFMQHIDTEHHGQHIADEMRYTSWTWTWLIWRWFPNRVDVVRGVWEMTNDGLRMCILMVWAW